MKKRIKALMLAVCLIAALPSSLRGNDMEAEAASRKVNVEVNFGIPEVMQYSVPGAFQSRFPAIDAKVSGFFLREFDIDVNFINTQYVVTNAPISVCRTDTTKIQSVCSCVNYNGCSNSGPYHHTNAAYNLDSIFPDCPTTKFQLHLTASKLCYIKGTTHTSVKGLNRSTRNSNGDIVASSMIVRDSDYVDEDSNVASWLGNTSNITWVSKTLTHELGHAYDVDDHYGIRYMDARDNCIWGYNKDNETVAYNLQMCSVCYSTIRDNTTVNHS